MTRLPLLLMPLLAATAAAAEPVRVYKSLGTVQCGSAGTPLPVLAQQLRDAGASVFASSCGSDGRMRAARCGGPDGRIGVFDVGAGDIDAAAKAGFAPLTNLPDAQVTPCQ